MKKQRENALKRIIKNAKDDRLNGYQPYDNFKIVTDKHCLVAIKEEDMTPFEVMQAKYDYLWLLTYDTSNKVQVNYEDLKALGEVDKVYYIGEEKPLYFENNEGEIGLVLPVRTF